MAVTWVVKSETVPGTVKKELYWGGNSWVPQIWDAEHFETRDEAQDFIRQRCDVTRKSNWAFGVIPIDSGDVY